jgi:hypothetical protein
MPKRIQMSRQTPWRAEHPDAVIVDRSSRWGNPFRVDGKRVLCGIELWVLPTEAAAVAHAVRAFRWQLENHPNVVGFTVEDVRRDLAGRDVACWCPIDAPCHGDVLLELANAPEPETPTRMDPRA